MKAFEVAAAVVGMVGLSPIARSQEVGLPADVQVYVGGTGLLSSSEYQTARSSVSGMFARVGVRIAWLDGKPEKGDALAGPIVILVHFVRQPMDTHSPEALAYTSPFVAGVTTITVLCDRIRLAAGWWKWVPPILSHVLAHELGHVLQRTDRHAETGVMKARWNRQDFERMKREPLEFTPTDVDLIQDGVKRLKARAGYQAGGATE